MTGVETTIPIIVAVIAAAGSVTMAVTGWRKAQGRIATSEAAQLWQESAAFRTVLLDRIEALEAEAHRQEDQITVLQNANSDLRSEVAKVRLLNSALTRDNERLLEKVAALEALLDGPDGPEIIAHMRRRKDATT